MELNLYEYKNYTPIAWCSDTFYQENSWINKLKIKYFFVPKNSKINGLDAEVTILSELNQIKRLQNPLVLIGKGLKSSIEEVVDVLSKYKLLFDHIKNYKSFMIDINSLVTMGITRYTDVNNNTIELNNINEPCKFLVRMRSTSKNNRVVLNECTSKGKTCIEIIGEDAYCYIGAGTGIESAEITVNSHGRIEVGKDCLISHGVVLMQTDHHHIFDLNTGKRINVSKNIIVGNHVWLGREVELLGGSVIGNNCVLGARCVTASKFESNCLVVGNPGKVIKKNIIWAEDIIRKNEINVYEDAMDKRGDKYV